ncbi:MAG: hypothetical protein KDN20_12185 [Verrucomicrobiae bacterium]|nr:hypothetical protein [Verrucomicrobiae bacterium]
MAIVQDWKIRSRSHQCCYTGDTFEDGEEFYTCIFVDPRSDGYVRRDYSIKHWPLILKNLDPPPFSFWKSTYEAPVVEAKKSDGMEHESAEAMLRRMIDEEDPTTENARYILALMLERKKTLKPVDEKITESGKLIFYEHKTSGEVFMIADPELKLDDLGKVQEEVAALLASPRKAADSEEVANDSPATGDEGNASEDQNEASNSSEDAIGSGETSIPEIMESTPNRLLHALKSQLDELVVQLSLGKAEAIDYVETHKHDLSERITKVSESLGDSADFANLRTKLDELRVQLALGRMESRDTYESQREKIHQAIDDACGEWHHLEEEAREELSEKSDSLKTKLNALALDLGLAAIVAEDELKVRKDEISAKAQHLAEKLTAAGHEASEEAESFVSEAREAWDDLKDNLSRLFR